MNLSCGYRLSVSLVVDTDCLVDTDHSAIVRRLSSPCAFIDNTLTTDQTPIRRRVSLVTVTIGLAIKVITGLTINSHFHQLHDTAQTIVGHCYTFQTTQTPVRPHLHGIKSRLPVIKLNLIVFFIQVICKM